MTPHDGPTEEFLAAVADLRAYDVSGRRAARLRAQCHATLQAQSRRNVSVARQNGTLFRRVIGPALAGVWCLAYLVEIVRRAAAAYGF